MGMLPGRGGVAGKARQRGAGPGGDLPFRVPCTISGLGPGVRSPDHGRCALNASSIASWALAYGFATDVGRVRERNEDNFLALPTERLFLVADGMGGHASGDVASRLCVDTVRHFYSAGDVRALAEETWTDLVGRQPELDKAHRLEEFTLYKALEAANLAIFRAAQKHEQHRTMGTTVVAIQVLPTQLLVGYVGDSRLYRLRGDTMRLLTEDHSLANEYLRLSLIRQEDLPRFAYKNVIVRALGLADHVQVDTFVQDLQAGDRLLLCSDGLTDLVPDAVIEEVLKESATTEAASRALVEHANEAGGHDNTTVLVIDIKEAGEEGSEEPPGEGKA